MKLIIQNNRISATATDEHMGNGSEQAVITAPADFDQTRMGEYVYDEETNTVVLVALRRITKLAFRNRFTQAEKIAIEIASLDNPAASMPARVQAAGIRVALADTTAAAFIDLDRPDTRAGVIAMETAGLLASGRALIILDAEIQLIERPVL